jgi:hypothetical protein
VGIELECTTREGSCSQYRTTQNASLEQNQPDHNQKRDFSSPDRIGCHNHPAEKYCHFGDAASNGKNNETERLKE